MNKKQAIAYAQIALYELKKSANDYISLEDLGLNMKCAFKIYSKDIAPIIANAKIFAEKKAKEAKDGDTVNE